jgi:hypothetical protein
LGPQDLEFFEGPRTGHFPVYGSPSAQAIIRRVLESNYASTRASYVGVIGLASLNLTPVNESKKGEGRGFRNLTSDTRSVDK